MRSEQRSARESRTSVLDSTSIRAQNRRSVLNLLWTEKEASRADLARKTGLSRSTVSAIVADLLETGLVREARTGVSTGGRRPIVLAFQADAALLVGVELGATHITVVLTDLYCTVRDQRDVPCPVRTEPETALDAVEQTIREMLGGSRGAPGVVGIGVAAPSPIDPRRPGELVASVVPAWEGHDIVHRLSRRFGRPVLLDNDANLGALAELRWGGTETRNLAYLKVATGIGAGLIFNGRIFRGASGVAGEIGHTTIDPNGPTCMCGQRGCLVTLVGTPSLLDRVRSARSEHPDSVLHQEPLNVDSLVDAALAGDALARETIEYAGRTLGLGVTNLLNLVNPDRVVVGGGITRAGELLAGPLRDTIRNRALADSIAHADIQLSSLGARGIALGAATLVLETALADPSMIPHRMNRGAHA